ncbi:hypothetical protein L6452_05580 [Arctium lappa]|uniref:Uncharacterized protein n=1 Tax=Arctium lappa TaxID=4217 RepID=A0ACB9EG77_ARCLA|nr:hypothetical protein L6452_05580 [Arctium lappa]
MSKCTVVPIAEKPFSLYIYIHTDGGTMWDPRLWYLVASITVHHIALGGAWLQDFMGIRFDQIRGFHICVCV